MFGWTHARMIHTAYPFSSGPSFVRFLAQAGNCSLTDTIKLNSKENILETKTHQFTEIPNIPLFKTFTENWKTISFYKIYIKLLNLYTIEQQKSIVRDDLWEQDGWPQSKSSSFFKNIFLQSQFKMSVKGEMSLASQLLTYCNNLGKVLAWMSCCGKDIKLRYMPFEDVEML